MMNGEELKRLRSADRKLKKILDDLYDDNERINKNDLIIKLLEIKSKVNEVAEQKII